MYHRPPTAQTALARSRCPRTPGSENVRATRAALAAAWGWFASGLAGRVGGAHLGRATSGLRSELGGWRSEARVTRPAYPDFSTTRLLAMENH